MMPRRRPGKPRDKEAERCLRAARAAGLAWKLFRERSCGQRWWEHLRAAYDSRCVYCDHSPARTIDHHAPKSKSKQREYDWNNWRAACGDCNRLKSRRRPFDPTREDPRKGLGFEPDTGKPFFRPKCSRAARSRAQASMELGLDNQTFNEARRQTVRGFLSLLADHIEKRRTRSTKTAILDYLRDPGAGNRAVLRDLILEHRLSVYGPIVEKALRSIPELAAWAMAPLES